jgi:hypothetical protein
LTGIYGQEFAAGRSKALIGYSELLHSVADDNLRVATLPLDDAGAVPLSWVDSFTVGIGCVDSCCADAVPTAINLNKNLRTVSSDVDAALSKAVPD